MVYPATPNNPLAKFVPTTVDSGDLGFLLNKARLFLLGDVKSFTKLEVETITWSLWAPYPSEPIGKD